ncbi:adenylate/guanylate cyclase domain-containing protein [uncultured Tateyamaria sp.]|uniref:adenylate/guanylate cyclase domain-containing protein n=1 Tax=Tateyamaria sp. 1078 TaxID=3417464 RepID=UPI00262EAE65|nr:adenylate/guanylate cyclase domain-containing protein [uncultured Tateyamaria sp.]
MRDMPGRLLIVDDNKVNRLLMSRSVEQLGHTAAVAENGRIAMEMLRARSYDILLLDIEMPEMDGFEVLEALKVDPKLRDLPVIVTSSVEGLDNIVRCIELGADDYIPKPVNKVLLNARVSASLERKRLYDEQKKLLDRFATVEVAQHLSEGGFTIGGQRLDATILFCDIRDFTSMSEAMTPEATIDLINTFYTLMFDAVSSQGGIVSLMVGDGLMALFGAPRPIENSAQCALAAAQDMLLMTAALNEERVIVGEAELRIGFGIATGEVVAGYTGTDDRATYTCIGKTVNLAARLEAHTKIVDRSVLFDEATFAGLTDQSSCTSMPEVRFKGFSDAMRVFAL